MMQTLKMSLAASNECDSLSSCTTALESGHCEPGDLQQVADQNSLSLSICDEICDHLALSIVDDQLDPLNNHNKVGYTWFNILYAYPNNVIMICVHISGISGASGFFFLFGRPINILHAATNSQAVDFMIKSFLCLQNLNSAIVPVD